MHLISVSGAGTHMAIINSAQEWLHRPFCSHTWSWQNMGVEKSWWDRTLSTLLISVGSSLHEACKQHGVHLSCRQSGFTDWCHQRHAAILTPLWSCVSICCCLKWARYRLDPYYGRWDGIFNLMNQDRAREYGIMNFIRRLLLRSIAWPCWAKRDK